MRAGLLAIAGLLMLGGPPAANAETFLDALAWRHRVVLVFAQAGAPGLDALRSTLAARACEARERELAVYRVDTDGVEALTPDSPSPAGADGARLVSRYGPFSQPLTLVLIGKDTGEKARDTRAEAVIGFLDLIDTMPMRQAEMAAAPSRC